MAKIARINKKLLIFFGSIVAVAMTMALYYVFMPAWIIAISAGEDENALSNIENRFKITEDDLAEFPSLRKALTHADEKDPNVFSVQPAKAWYWDGKNIVERFDMDSQYPHGVLRALGGY